MNAGNTESQAKHVRTFTFGCKVNDADTAHFERLFASHGAIVNHPSQAPDTVFINTCTVTKASDRQARQLVRKVHRLYPEAKVVVTGCYAQAKPNEISQLPGVQAVVPFRQQINLPVIMQLNQSTSMRGDIFSGSSQKTRAVLKVQNGCNAYCAFCILPYVRGRSQSLPIDEVFQQLRSLEQDHYTEVVLTGTHIGAYGRDLEPRMRFSDLVRSMILRTAIPHFRISSLEPTTLTPDLIQLVRDQNRIRPHFHIPLQSGSTSVLRRMNRKYKVQNYIDRVNKLSSTRSHMGLGTDVIVGFRDESEEEFQETLKLCKALPFTYIHVFPYSPREGTKSFAESDTVTDEQKRHRVDVLRALSLQKSLAFAKPLIGTVQPVLLEKRKHETGAKGYTPHYLNVEVDAPDELLGFEVPVLINDVSYQGNDDRVSLKGTLA